MYHSGGSGGIFSGAGRAVGVGCEDAHRATRSGGRGENRRLLRDMPGRPARRRTRGTVVHRTAVPWLADCGLGRRPAGSMAGRRSGRGRRLVPAGTAGQGEPGPGQSGPRGAPGGTAARSGPHLAAARGGPSGRPWTFGGQRSRARWHRRRGFRSFGRGRTRACGRATRDGRGQAGRRNARPATRASRAGGCWLFAGVMERAGARGVYRAGPRALQRAQRRAPRPPHRTRGLGRTADT